MISAYLVGTVRDKTTGAVSARVQLSDGQERKTRFSRMKFPMRQDKTEEGLALTYGHRWVKRVRRWLFAKG